MVTGFEVHVDAAALADMERAEEAARAHVAAMGSAGGKATMSGVHAPRIQSAGCKAGAKAGGKATMSGVHAPRIQSAGGKATRGKIRGTYNKPYQTAHQQAEAARKRKYYAAARAAEAKV